MIASCAGSDLLGPLGEEAGGGDVGGSELQVAGAVLGLGGDPGAVGGVVELGRAEQRQRLQPRRRVVAVAGLEAVEAVGGEDRAGDQRLGGGLRVLGLGQRPGERGCLQARRLLGGDRGGDAQLLGVDLVALAEADDEDGREPVRAQEGEFLEARTGGVGAAAAATASGSSLVLEQPDRDQVGADSRPAPACFTSTFIGRESMPCRYRHPLDLADRGQASELRKGKAVDAQLSDSWNRSYPLRKDGWRSLFPRRHRPRRHR